MLQFVIHTKTQAFVIRNYLESQFSMTMKNHKVNCIVHFVEIKLLKLSFLSLLTV